MRCDFLHWCAQGMPWFYIIKCNKHPSSCCWKVSILLILLTKFIFAEKYMPHLTQRSSPFAGWDLIWRREIPKLYVYPPAIHYLCDIAMEHDSFIDESSILKSDVPVTPAGFSIRYPCENSYFIEPPEKLWEIHPPNPGTWSKMRDPLWSLPHFHETNWQKLEQNNQKHWRKQPKTPPSQVIHSHPESSQVFQPCVQSESSGSGAAWQLHRPSWPPALIRRSPASAASSAQHHLTTGRATLWWCLGGPPSPNREAPHMLIYVRCFSVFSPLTLTSSKKII